MVKDLPVIAEDTGDACSIPGSGRFPGGENGNPLQYSCWGNPMERGGWRATVHGVAESDRTEQLNNNTVFQSSSLPYPETPVSCSYMIGIVNRKWEKACGVGSSSFCRY